jgi:diguanylate cyclase (GGDEF)-like protein/PAS domain S-box-containing protein
MNTRNKILLIIGVTIIIISGLLYWHTASTWLNGYEEIETKNAQQDINRLRFSLGNVFDRLNTTAHDWAAWDDTYQFIVDQNPAFIETNLGIETFTRLEINMILFVSDRGELVYGKAINFSNQQEETIPQGIKEHLQVGKAFYPPSTTDGYRTGLLYLQGKPMLLAVRPILTSAEQGPIRGAVVMGYWLDDKALAAIDETTQLSITSTAYGEPGISPDIQQALVSSPSNPTYISTQNKQQMEGYLLERDLYDKPALILSITNPRDITSEVQGGINVLVFAFFLTSLACVLFIYTQLDKYLLNRLKNIGLQINEVTTSGDLSRRLLTNGEDEFSDLVRQTNQMLASIETSRQELSKALNDLEEQTISLSDANVALQSEVIHRQEIEEALRKKTDHQHRLIETASNLTQSLDVNQVLQRIAAGAWEIVQADGCAIYLLDKDKITLKPVVVVDPRFEKEIMEASMQVDTSFTGQAIKYKRGMIFNDSTTNEQGFQVPGTPLELEEKIIVAPLSIDEEIVGAICIDRRKLDFTSEDLALVEVYATYASTALKNARIHDSLQREVNERRQAESALRESEERNRSLVENISLGIYRTTPGAQGRFLMANPAFLNIFGFESEEELFQTTPASVFINPKERKAFSDKLLKMGKLTNEEHYLKRMDSTPFWASVDARVVCDDMGSPMYFDCNIQDINQRKQAEKIQETIYQISQSATETQSLDELYQRVHELIKGLIPADNFYVALFDSATKQFSFPYFVDENDTTPASGELGKSLTAYLIRKGEAMLVSPDLSNKLIEQGEVEMIGTPSLDWLGVPLKTTDNTTIGAMIVQTYNEGVRYTHSHQELLSIVSNQVALAIERKRAEEKLAYNAFHDELTGLPNRSLFLDRLGHAIKLSSRRSERWFAVLFLDLDHFKTVNDSLGHVLGDQLLISVARRLGSCLRTYDTIARFGGDEFVILLEDVESTGEVLSIADRILSEITTPFILAGHEMIIRTSIGIVYSSPVYEKAEEMLRDADIAMYQAKATGRGRYVIFNETMRANVVAHIEMEKDFRQAIERKEWELHYQPILSLKNGQIIGFEALIRWNHPRKGMIWPNDFIPFAEETGLIIPMGEWVLREACRQMSIWHGRFPTDPPLTISVNLSSKQFTQAELFNQIQNAITETHFDPHYLRLEITESVIMENAERAISTLNRLQRMGVQVHIDDFGTGYSSLVYLHMLPINAIKIDHSFISGNGIQNHHGLEIAQSIVRLAHDLKMETIAEGVETQAQFDKLTDLECEYAQGYHISLCLGKEIAEKLLEEKFTPAKTIPKVN